MPLNWSLDLFKRIAACDQAGIDALVAGGSPGCMYAFHPGRTNPLPFRLEGNTLRADPHEVVLAVSDGLYGRGPWVDFGVLAAICVALFIGVVVAVKLTKK
jgi:hypothetical protein